MMTVTCPKCRCNIRVKFTEAVHYKPSGYPEGAYACGVYSNRRFKTTDDKRQVTCGRCKKAMERPIIVATTKTRAEFNAKEEQNGE